MEEVRPFLDNVLRGLPVPKERYEAVVHHYELDRRQEPSERADRTARLRACGAWLRAEGLDLPVYVGMRFAKPFMFTAIRDMIRDGRRRAVGIVLAPYRSEPSFEKYQEAVQEVLDAAGPDAAPRVDFVEPWFDHPLFAEAQADQVRRALETIPRRPPRLGPAGLHGPQHPAGGGRTLPLRVSDRDRLRERRPPPRRPVPGSSPGRAAAATPAPPGSSPTSTPPCRAQGARESLTWSSARSALFPTTSKCCTTWTSRPRRPVATSG